MGSAASFEGAIAKTIAEVNVLAQAYSVGRRASERRGFCEHVGNALFLEGKRWSVVKL